MNDAYFTQIGERPDLAAIEVNPPEGYIASKIYPVVPTVDKSGTTYYATITADSAAQTGRSVATAPTATQISDSSTTFTTAEVVKRAGVTPDEVKQMGGIEKADMVGAKWAKRQVLNYLEGAARDELLVGTADYTFDPAKLLTQIQDAAQALRLYEGRTTLVCSTRNLKSITQTVLADSTFGTAFSHYVSNGASLSFEAMKAALTFLLGVDDVLAGDDSVWNAATVTGRFAIAKIDNSGDAMSHKYTPVLGKCYQFMPDGTNPWVIQSNANRDTINNTYDAFLWYDIVTLNSGAKKIFNGVSQ